MDLKQVIDADHTVAIWNQFVPPGTDVYRVDDMGHLHRDTTRSRAWVLQSGSAVVKTVGAGPYKLSRIWTREALEAFVDRFGPEGSEPIDALRSPHNLRGE